MPEFSSAAYTTQTTSEVLKKLETSLQGLKDQEVVTRQRHYGLNQVEDLKTSGFSLLKRQVTSPFVIVFLLVILLSVIVGEYYNAIIIFACVAINIIISFYQEYRASKALLLLRHYLVSHEKVIRNNNEIVVAREMLVPGDILVISPGDVLPADVRFLEQSNITLDESALTGESQPVAKNSEALPKKPDSVYKALNIGFAGTTVLSGEARVVVVATGMKTQLGTIAFLTLASMRESSFAQKIKTLSSFLVKLILITLACVFVANIVIKTGKLDIFQLFIFSTALIITVIPEALPAVVTFALANGVAGLAKKKVIVKRLSAVESLGSIEILCTDKTGTLTENTLTIASIYSINTDEQTLLYAGLAYEIAPDEISKNQKSFDAVLWKALPKQIQEEVKEINKIKEIPYDPLRRRNTSIIQYKKDILFIERGMFEEVLRHCLILKHEKELYAWAQQEGKKGYRVIALGAKKINKEDVDKINDDIKDLELIGLISFADPLKKTVSEAVKKAKALDVSLKILSGDSKEVCGAIGYQIGLLASPEDVITGQELEKKSSQEKYKLIKNNSVFARILPEQKYEIIKLLQRHAEVGYLGDGINDAPALKIADVSLAVDNAVDIARDTADIILLQKNLLVIINGIEEGRKIFANTLKYIKTTLSSNFGNFYALSVATLFINYLPMLPLHLLLINLLTDFPFIAISTDSIDADQLKKPKLYDVKDILSFAMLFGLVSSMFYFIFFALFRTTQDKLQTGLFLLDVLSEVTIIFSLRTHKIFYKAKKPSWLLIGLVMSVIVVTLTLPYTTIGQNVLQFKPLPLSMVIIIVILVVSYFTVNEIVKYWYYEKLNHKSKLRKKSA